MIKFWKEDFEYIKRTGWSGFNYKYDHQYHFSVCGESANYLINEYGLFGYKVEVHVIDYGDYITVTSKERNTTYSDCTEIDEKDKEELMGILQDFIEQDKRNWEEYLCDDWYKKDSRWE